MRDGQRLAALQAPTAELYVMVFALSLLDRVGLRTPKTEQSPFSPPQGPSVPLDSPHPQNHPCRQNHWRACRPSASSCSSSAEASGRKNQRKGWRLRCLHFELGELSVRTSGPEIFAGTSRPLDPGGACSQRPASSQPLAAAPKATTFASTRLRRISRSARSESCL